MRTSLLLLLLIPLLVSAQKGDRYPSFKGQEGLTNYNERVQNLNTGIARHIASNTDRTYVAQHYAVGDTIELTIGFTIDYLGKIDSRHIRVGGNPDFANHVKYVISTLPTLIPAKSYDGEPANHFYVGTPSFLVAQNGNLEAIPPPKLVSNISHKPPVFPGCESAVEKERLNCMSEKISLLLRKNIKGWRSKGRVLVIFTISKAGEITIVKSNVIGEKNEWLREEVNKLINGLPPIEPARNPDGAAVEITYSLPITFN